MTYSDKFLTRLEFLSPLSISRGPFSSIRLLSPQALTWLENLQPPLKLEREQMLIGNLHSVKPRKIVLLDLAFGYSDPSYLTEEQFAV